MNISSILSTKSSDIITIGPEQSISEALSLLSAHNIGALVVTISRTEVVGILSERDIVHLAAKGQGFLDVKVEKVMTRQVIVAVPQDDVMSVAHTMTERRFRHIPVIDKNRLIGIVSIGDILKAQRDQYSGQIDTLETQIMASDD